MAARNRAILALGLTILLAVPAASASDRISVWRPLDIEQQRKSYESSGREFPEELLRKGDRAARERHEELTRQLAPVEATKDSFYGKYYFEGRILEIIAPVDPSAPRNDPDHWSKIVFEAYGKGGTPESRKPTIVSMLGTYFQTGDSHIDTMADFSRLLSNHHEIMNVEFGSPRHRQAIFAALDPDGSMGLPIGGTEATSSDLKEGALMVFAKQGVPSDMIVRMKHAETNPIDPILLFDQGSHLSLPYSLIEEYARSMRYPTSYEAAYGETAKAALQIFYALSLAVPELTSPQYQARARRFHTVGESTYRALSDTLHYRLEGEGGWEYRGEDNSLLPVTGDDVRRAALDVLADGSVVPSPLIKEDGGNASLIWSLMRVIEFDESLAPVAQKVLERHLAPEAGEDPDVTALYELDREQNRIRGWPLIRGDVGDDDPVHPATYAYAQTGWGEKEEMEEIISMLLYNTIRVDDDLSQRSIDVMRLIAQPEKYTRKDRQKYSNAAATELERQITEIRNTMERGFGSAGQYNFMEAWDAGNK